MKTISREALFKDAWTRPLSRIAAEFGVSDTALRKMCDRHDIPTPGRGYWAQIASGKSFPPPQLRPAKDSRFETVRIVGASQPLPEVKVIIETAKAQAAAKASSVLVSKTTAASAEEASADELHSLVRRTHARLEAAGAKGAALVQVSGKGLFGVTASSVQAERMGRLLSLLMRAVEARGWTAEDSEKGFRLLPDGEAIGFEITEQTLRKPHRTPKPSRRRWRSMKRPRPALREARAGPISNGRSRRSGITSLRAS